MKKFILILLISTSSFAGNHDELMVRGYRGSSWDDKREAINQGRIPEFDGCGRNWIMPGYGTDCEDYVAGGGWSPQDEEDKLKAESNKRAREQTNEVARLKKECEELGFKPGTKKFKDCVVELM